jgi:hypothetical protein
MTDSACGDASVEISVRGQPRTVPSVSIGERDLFVSRGWLRIAEVKDEAWLAQDAVPDPETCLARIRRANLGADLFTFAQKLPDTEPRYAYPMEWDNVAAIPTASFDAWWQGRLPQETRKNVRRAARRGVVVRDTQLDQALLRGIVDINNESPVRQGRRFWHYGKSPAAVERDYATLLEHSVYLGAYYQDELIGFIKLVDMGAVAAVLQLLCKQAHSDKRPANALLARAVEMCCAQGRQYLIYGQYVYGAKFTSPLLEFKRRNGFEPIFLPRYYVPLTARGRMALALNLHHGYKSLVPDSLLALALRLRSAWYDRRFGRKASADQ